MNRRMLAPLRPAARILTGSTYALLGFDALREPGGRTAQAAEVLSAIRQWVPLPDDDELVVRDRKSTRLNSSHVEISYAVFCLKKKKNKQINNKKTKKKLKNQLK